MGVLSDVAKVTGEEVSMVLANKIGSMNAGISESQRATILERCREPMEAARLLVTLGIVRPNGAVGLVV